MNTNDAKLAELLPKFGIDPALAYDGFRAAHPFPVAVRLAMLGKRVMPSNKHKIPMTREWQHRASADPATLVRWQVHKQPPCWSILSGLKNGIEILDVDGEQGRADLMRLESEYGLLPRTWAVISGRMSGGAHLWFRAPESGEDLRTVAHVFGCAVDVRGWHGHAVLPGSLHKSGRRYAWADGCSPDEIELAELPTAWREALPKRIEGNARTIKLPSARRGSSSGKSRRRSPASLLIGDGPGYGGFQDPIFKNAIQYFLKAGVEAPESIIIKALREMISEAPKDEGRDVSRYMAGNDLSRLVKRAREFCESTKG